MDGYTSLSNFIYSPQPSFSNSIWEWELNLQNHRSVIYYSVSEFNEPEFEEYDPTPYDGGYDQALTYGKPLPPSEAICYPLSTPEPTQPIPPPLQVPSNGSTINPPNGGAEEVNHSRSPPSRKKSTEEETPSFGGEPISSHGDSVVPAGNGNGNGSDTCYEYPLDSFHLGWFDYGCGDGYGRQEPQNSWSDCGSEKGFCESLFGYWPCLSKKDREQRRSSQQQIGEEQRCGDQWGETADFLFGSLYPYGERRNTGEVNSGNERYYQQQYNYKQSESNQIWVQNPSYYQQASPSHYIDGEDSYYQQQYNYKQNESNQIWFQSPSYYQASPSHYIDGEDSYYQQQDNYKQNESNQIWVQNPSYYQASPTHFIDGEDSYYYNQSKYYDE
ncbi:hypothetical protein NE237_010253 [Protea cynaroides]|uniref:Uncharacterized protein n=1 Tax=Protea cynaroides TaxID=273540 RepID=A0A9Q0KZ79_9MAGN|nr:hypothetical protein NE237_010253 [Protea cynaroides]